MKKIFTKLMLLAVAATAIVSCENNFNDTTVNGDTNLVKVTLTADKPTVVSVNRTELGNEGQPLWSVGDQIGAYAETGVDGEGKTTYGNYALKNDNETEATATTTFTGNTTLVNTLFPYYPYTAVNDPVTDKGAKVEMPANQNPTVTSFDGKADLMIAKPVTLDAEGKQLNNLEFARVGAIVKVVLKDKTGNLADQHISSLTMTAESNLVGRIYLDVVNQELGELYYNQSKSVTANYDENTQFVVNGTNAVYVVVYPQVLASGSTLSFEASTEGYAITKEITLSQDIDLAMGKITTLNVSLAAENVVAEAAGLALPVEDDFAWATGTSGVTPSGELWSTDYSTLFGGNGSLRIGSSNVRGHITTNPLDLSQPFTVIVDAMAWSADSSQLAVTVGDVTQTSANLPAETAGFTTYTFKFDAAGTKEAVKIAVTGKRGFIDNLHIVAGHDAVLPPVLTVNVESITNISDKGEDVTFVYEVANPVEGTSVVITDDADWITTADNNGTVTATVAENPLEEERNATITVKYGDLTETVAIQQNAKPAAGGPTTVVDVLNRALTGVTGSSYTAWSGKTSNSSAVYAGQSAGGNNAIQLRTTNSNSGIVTTTSGGKVTKIVVTWNSNTNANRTLDIYGKNTAYTQATDLYSPSTQGTKLGSLKNGTTTLEITGDYAFIGMRSNDSAMYLDEIQITWETGGSEGGETPETPAPVLAVTSATTINVAAAGDAPTITYTITNPVVGQSVTASADQTWVNGFEVSNTDVTFIVDENTGAARTATVTLAYQGAESKTVTVSQAAGNTGGGDDPATKVWTLVTDASTIAAGDQIIIAASGYNYAISTTQNSNNRGQAAITKSGETLATPANDVQIFTVEAGSTSGTFAFNATNGSNTGYIYCASNSSKNYLRTQATVDAKASWTISVTNTGIATIKSQVSGISRNLLSYNQQSSCFACYSSVQKDVVIYKLQ